MYASKYQKIDKKIVKFYNDGLSSLSIAKKFGICEKTVDYRLKINGIKKRSISQALKGKPKTEIHKKRVSVSRIKS
ncbi:MAG: hypothetical protein KKE05_02195, partial [Nanoarchaeota archaeon]|nr:hypothetical protein [Nanoarchaeota archaeon]